MQGKKNATPGGQMQEVGGEVFRRNGAKTRGQLLRAELGESWDHALRAAGHAAGGVKAAVGPKVAPTANRVRGVATNGWGSTKQALAPISEAARAKVKNRKDDKVSKRWPRLAALLAGGAAVGAATAYAVRRRRRQQWEEYEAAEAEAVETTLGAGDDVGARDDPLAAPDEATPPEEAEAGRFGAGVADFEHENREAVDVSASKNSRG